MSSQAVNELQPPSLVTKPTSADLSLISAILYPMNTQRLSQSKLDLRYTPTTDAPGMLFHLSYKDLVSKMAVPHGFGWIRQNKSL